LVASGIGGTAGEGAQGRTSHGLVFRASLVGFFRAVDQFEHLASQQVLCFTLSWIPRVVDHDFFYLGEGDECKEFQVSADISV
jgi:hypothetical protein